MSDDAEDFDEDQLQLQREMGRRGRRRGGSGGYEEEFVTEAPLPLRKVPRIFI